MSVYSCDICSFYADRKHKITTHLNTQKHQENMENKLKNITPLSYGQKNMRHRTLIRSNAKKNINISPQQTESTQVQPPPPTQSVFTLLEIQDNKVITTKQVNMKNSVINFI